MRISFFTCLLLSGGFIITARAQSGLCPPNLDFEMGDFTNWVCRTGSVLNGNVVWTRTGQVNNRHTIISRATAGVDPWAGFSQIAPNGSGYSVRLGNDITGGEMESISYTYSIPPGVAVFSILYQFAVVLEDPGHAPKDQPRFVARVIDVATNNPIPCVDFDFISSSSIPGFINRGRVVYKDWTPVTLNLSGYAGKTIRLEFITNDCVPGGHFGYAYIDVSSACLGAIGGTVICNGDTSITLTAPNGFQSYAWYTSSAFTKIIDTTQKLILTPLPTVGTVIPVIVTPYPGYGCVDTLYATVSVASKPPSVAGADISICKHEPVQLGTAPTVGYSYAWTPADQVNNPILANPIAVPMTQDSTAFIVKTTNLVTGCYAYDTAIISTRRIDTSLNVFGKDKACTGDPSPAILSLNNISASIQWYDSTHLLGGVNTAAYQPPVSGSYWARLQQYGCIDSTRTIPVQVYPLPQASFSSVGNSDTLCISNNPFVFTNTSMATDNEAMTYQWKFSDGEIDTTLHVSKTFLSAGSYNVKLIATTSFGCKDSLDKTIWAMPNGVPDFSVDPVCVNRPVLFKNLSSENGTPRATYSWEFNNGTVGSLLKDPLPIVYLETDTVQVRLQMISLGCETRPQTISKTVEVHAPKPSTRYHDITVPEGNFKWLEAKGEAGDNYNWRPAIQLNNYNTRYVEFNAAPNDVKYLIDITDKYTCLRTDTLQIFLLKKPGYYLPTAFTPNGDGLNDIIKPYLVAMKSLKRFSIYNRWGNLVFSTGRAGEGWDGRRNGVAQDAGTYVWVLEFMDNNNILVIEKGTLTLIR